jgi:hypothetical protein
MGEFIDEQTPDEIEAAERPEWLPDNFRTPAALLDSYEELQRAFHQRSQELADTRRELDDLEEFNQLDSGEGADPDASRAEALSRLQALAHDAASRTIHRILDDPAARQLQAGAEGMYAELDRNADPDFLASASDRVMADRYGVNWLAAKPAVAEVLEELPHLIPDEGATFPMILTGLDNAFQVAQGRAAQQHLTEIQRAEQMRLAKQRAQTLSGAAGRPAPLDDDEEFFQRIMAARGQSYAAMRGN